jgi:ubiquinone/menaquinone biosynthesis C-methylase UbiE
MKKEIIFDLKELDRYLNKIKSIFPVKTLIQEKVGVDKITNYYKESSAGYHFLHSNEGAVHMAINYDGVFHKEGYYTQAKEISELINKNAPKKILELGCGKGFNSIYLAKTFPNMKFSGIDITEKHLQLAIKKSKKIKNLTFSFGDFHKLDFPNSSFDLIFELEAICHAKNPSQVLTEIYRLLTKKGQFVLYEGFRNIDFEKYPANLVTAAILTEKSMAVNKFENIDIWLKIAQQTGFTIKLEQDLSKAIMPNLKRLQFLARGYFKYPFLSRIFLRILPLNMVMNSIAGLLMPFTLQNKAHVYYKIILEK